jgi:hypothetical protein
MPVAGNAAGSRVQCRLARDGACKKAGLVALLLLWECTSLLTALAFPWRWALHFFTADHDFFARLLALAGVDERVFLFSGDGDGCERRYGESGDYESGEKLCHSGFLSVSYVERVVLSNYKEKSTVACAQPMLSPAGDDSVDRASPHQRTRTEALVVPLEVHL